MNAIKYFILDDTPIVYIECDNKYLKYDNDKSKWVDATTYVNDALVGFDEFEPVGSPYRFGGDRKEKNYISKESAELLLDFKINENDIDK